MPSKDHHTPAPLLGGSSKSKRQPAGEIIYIPTTTSPSDWSRKDKNAVSSAVAMGVIGGLFAWSIIAGLFLAFLGTAV